MSICNARFSGRNQQMRSRPIHLLMTPQPRTVVGGARLFAALVAAVSLAVFGVGCQQALPEKESSTPGPPVGVPGPEAETGTPDLSVWVPDEWTAPINFDENSSEFGVAWTNRGSAMAEDYSIVLTVDGSVVYRWDKPVLAPGSERIEVIGLNDLLDPHRVVQGKHKLELIVDPTAVVEDQDRENNSYSLVRDFQLRLPDFRPSAPQNTDWEGPVVIGGSDLIYGRADEAPERGYFLAFGVANRGAVNAHAWPQRNSFELNGHPVKQWESRSDSDPSPGNVQLHAVPVWKVTLGGEPLLIGDQRIIVNIDTTNTAIESDEENNFLSGLVRLPPSRARSGRDQPDTRDLPRTPTGKGPW